MCSCLECGRDFDPDFSDDPDEMVCQDCWLDLNFDEEVSEWFEVGGEG